MDVVKGQEASGRAAINPASNNWLAAVGIGPCDIVLHLWAVGHGSSDRRDHRGGTDQAGNRSQSRHSIRATAEAVLQLDTNRHEVNILTSLFRYREGKPIIGVKRQRDLLIDLEVPSLGVLMRQRIQKRIADAPAVEAANTLDGTPVAREQQGASGAGNLAPSVPVERAWKHSGYFGQDMSTKTRVFTFPIVRTQKQLTEDQESRPTRQWKNLMEPRKPEDAAVTSRQKLKRRAVNQLPEVAPAYLGGGVASDLYPPKNLSPTVPPPRCHCRESPANRSLEDLLELVPSISRTIHKSANGSIIKEIIRASLSKSLELERVYGQRDCHCNCQVPSAHFVKGAARVTVRPQHKILTWNPARGRRTSSSPGVEATQANRSPPSYRSVVSYSACLKGHKISTTC
ncbi:hypothetical protein HPB47_013030 [Ixodes persulcatus]|uniref:Uncharacterized protein n=1 Tax=Ixodes persulcatus TaxID=34615 RepID=A0AC60NRW9_IXOPE|nr:hypothetical protein HPB47_013030 [Ixodes persulcatus]